jgi:hypothetical protein
MSMHSDRRKILIGLGAAALGSAALGARAQGSTPAPGRASVYSSGKLIRVLNGFPAGGSADVVSRLVADGIRRVPARASLSRTARVAGAARCSSRRARPIPTAA